MDTIITILLLLAIVLAVACALALKTERSKSAALAEKYKNIIDINEKARIAEELVESRISVAEQAEAESKANIELAQTMSAVNIEQAEAESKANIELAQTMSAVSIEQAEAESKANIELAQTMSAVSIEQKLKAFESKKQHEQQAHEHKIFCADQESIKAIEKALEQSKLDVKKILAQSVVDLKVANEALANLKADYAAKRPFLDELIKEIKLYERTNELGRLGFYQRDYEFDHSEKSKCAIEKVRDKQKTLLRNKTKRGAIWCSTEWSVGDSRAEGKKMTNRNIRLTARAFNNECDAAISNAKWNNLDQMSARIEKGFETINDLNEPNQIYISDRFLELKLQELKLTCQYREQRQDEKVELRELNAQIREEERAEVEIQKALFDAEKDEVKFIGALAKAREQANAESGAKLSKLEDKIAKLQQSLLEAQERKDRAKSMAEQTKAGHVYVISNIGIYGNNVYKIGMTRRLEPLDRVRELSNASVPFRFDVHAMIRSDDAPTLEKSLHRKFEERRVNKANSRKEFFTVSLDEVKDAVDHEHGGDAEFYETAVAKEWRETQAIIRSNEAKANEQVEADEEHQSLIARFPEAI
ncbi:MAG: hypothetical protein ACJAS1_005297 [Oleiphilaceae bacterium]|jgi:hypothetical protein